MTSVFRQIYWAFGAIMFISLIGGSWEEEMSENAVSSPMQALIPPLAVISDTPMSLAKSMSKVPLVPVSLEDLVVVRNAEITAMSPDNTLVQCFNDRTGLTEAMPAVKLLLRTPVLMNPGLERPVVDFPSSVNVVHRGSLLSLPVGALIAPINYQRLSQPLIIKTVYAVPTFPLNHHITPPLASTPYSRPFVYPPYPLPYTLYNEPYINYRPFGALQPMNAPKPMVSPMALPMATPVSPAVAAMAAAPMEATVAAATIKQPSSPYGAKPSSATGSGGQSQSQGQPPVVTVLDFPEAVASPSVLYYQPPISSDSEFENREPPQPVVPAGIIQSTAPQPNQQLFMNSKESVYLLTIKEDLKKL